MRKVLPNILLVELIVLDCDGVLTDVGYFTMIPANDCYASMPEMVLIGSLRHSGRKAAILSGRPTDIAHHRFAELGLHPIKGRSRDKAKDVLSICTEPGVPRRELPLSVTTYPTCLRWRRSASHSGRGRSSRSESRYPLASGS